MATGEGASVLVPPSEPIITYNHTTLLISSHDRGSGIDFNRIQSDIDVRCNRPMPHVNSNHSLFPFFVTSLFFGHPEITYFRYFFDFCGVCLGIFFGSGFGRPPGIIFGGFWGDFRHVFSCSLEDVGRGSVLRKTSFRIVIYSVFGTSTFSKKVEKRKKHV